MNRKDNVRIRPTGSDITSTLREKADRHSSVLSALYSIYINSIEKLVQGIYRTFSLWFKNKNNIKKFIAFLSISSLGAMTLQAQNVAFVKEISTDSPVLFDRIKKTPDGNIMLLGSIRKANSLGREIRDLQLIKLTPQGDTLWTKYLEHGRSERGRDLEILDNGDMLIAGSSSYYNPSYHLKGFLFYVDSTGTLLWKKYYGDEIRRWSFNSIKVTDDAVIMAGTSENEMRTQALIVKADLNGDSLWSSVIGGRFLEYAYDVEVHPDGGYVFTGGTYNYATGTEDDAWIVKIDANGAFEWRKTYGTPNMPDRARAFVPSYNSSGEIDGYVFTGRKESDGIITQNSNFCDVYLVKVDTAGTLIWDRSISLPPEVRHQEGFDITSTMNGGYAICVYESYTRTGSTDLAWGQYFLEIDEDGEIVHELFDHINANSLLPRSIIQWDDTTFYTGGSVISSNPENGKIFLSKITTGSGTGIKNNAILDRSIAIYPNPSSGMINIANTGNNMLTEITILSIDGKVLKTIPISNKRGNAISVEEFKNQTLVLCIKDNKGNVAYKKINVL